MVKLRADILYLPIKCWSLSGSQLLYIPPFVVQGGCDRIHLLRVIGIVIKYRGSVLLVVHHGLCQIGAKQTSPHGGSFSPKCIC